MKTRHQAGGKNSPQASHTQDRKTTESAQARNGESRIPKIAAVVETGDRAWAAVTKVEIASRSAQALFYMMNNVIHAGDDLSDDLKCGIQDLTFQVGDNLSESLSAISTSVRELRAITEQTDVRKLN